MKVLYDERIKQAGDLLSLAEQATPQLEDVVGPSHAEAQAEWGYEEEGGRKWATLQIRDAPDEARTRLALEELQKTSRVRVRLLRLWGNLLQARTHRLIQNVLNEGANGEGPEGKQRPRRRERQGKQMTRRQDRRRKSSGRDTARGRCRTSRNDRSPEETMARITSELDVLAKRVALLEQRCAELKAIWERRRRWMLLGPLVGGLFGGVVGSLLNYFTGG